MTRNLASAFASSASSWARIALVPVALASCDPGTKVPPLRPVTMVPIQPSSVHSAPVADAGSPGSSEDKHIAATLRKVSAVRGLAALHSVPGVVLERTDLVAAVRKKADSEYPKAALERDARVMELLGFAPTPFDYLGELSKLLEAQLDGFYEPKNGTMYVASDLAGDAANLALAHELVHALQDQHYDLKPRTGYHPGRSDEIMAGSMLAEGDATSAMLDVSLKAQGQTALDLPESLFSSMLSNAMNTGDTANAPRFLRSTLVFPYVEGTLFVHALRRQGGFAHVDDAWRDLPKTTEQVLHPEKWTAHEAALAVPAPTATALGAGFSRVDEDTGGEGGLRIVLEEWAGPTDAKLAAAGWGGDRSGVYANGKTLASAMLVVTDKPEKGPEDAFAKRALDKVRPGLEKIAGKASKDATFVCIDRPKLGPLALGRKGRAYVVLAGPSERTEKAEWTPKGTCALAHKWADEVLAQGAQVR